MPALFLLFLEVNTISKDLQVNEEIRGKEVRVVSESGEQLGIMTVRDALRMATENGLDLVKVAPNAEPPVCRIMDYGKFKYEQSKLDKEAKKKQTIISIKEIKMRPNIEDHDFLVKMKNVSKFLEDGDKVKLTIMFRGREISHPQLGEQLLVNVAEIVKEIATVEKSAKLEGKNMVMILMPKQVNKKN